MDEFGMNFHLPYFQHKNGWYQMCFFHLFMGYEFLMNDGWILRYYFHLFMGYEFLIKDIWILRYVFHLFTGYKFLMKDIWILRYYFHLFTGIKSNASESKTPSKYCSISINSACNVTHYTHAEILVSADHKITVTSKNFEQNFGFF